MPIYAYRCSACGHEKDVLQKISAEPLSACPACNTENFSKQITAAGFQLKGSGWYATDFKSNSSSSGSASSNTSSESAAPAPCGASCACH